MGREFMVSLPGMLSTDTHNTFPRINFNLVTMEIMIKVHISTQWYDRETGNIKLTMYVQRNDVTKFHVPPKYLYDLLSGLRWTFRLVSNLNFGVLVELFDDVRSAATLTLIPVDAWGLEYYCFTMGYRPFAIITSSDGPNLVQFTIRARYVKRFFLYIGDVKLIHKSNYEISLNGYQSFALSGCANESLVGPMTGTRIKGMLPFAVVTGSCYASTSIKYCSGEPTKEEGKGDIVAEMLMPVEAYGYDFITFEVYFRIFEGYYVFISSSKETLVTVYKSDDKALRRFEIHLEFKGDWRRTDLPIQRFHSTHPIQVLYFHKSTCKARPDKPSSEEGGPSVTIIVPTNLFYFKYIWGSPYELGEHHYITIIIKTIYVNDIYHNGVHLMDKIPWQNVYDPFYKSDWKTGMMSASPRYLHILSSPKTSFGCYLYGFNGHTSYISPAGFLTSHINTYCTSSVSTMKIDDLVDNDCDLQVDEELENGVDDDDDRQIDEDLRSEGFIPTTESAVSTMSKVTNMTKVPTTLFPRNASGTVPSKTSRFITMTLPNATTMEPSTTFRTTRITPRTNWRSTEDYTAHLYSTWSIWQCDENCYETRQKRTRVCLVDECTEQVLQWRKAECYVMYTCPKFCKDFEWGIGCNKSCANCLDTCDKYNGSCTTCLPFFTSPANGCQSEILGVWQEWTCAEECHTKSMYRKRLCPTMEPNCTKVQMKSGSCHINTCPKDCPLFKWGADCKYSCANCESDCDKYNGSCTRCKPGFKNQRAGCLQECDRFKFGVNCSQDCKIKCDQDDCGDRRTGECPVHGKFGHWTAWHCTRDCFETRMSRERFCNHPQPRLGGLECQGHAQEWKTSVCYLRKDKICPIDCPEQKWGVNCGNECPNCLDDCDKFFGNCTMCKKGFKNASHSCNAGCDRNEFGFDCLGDCVAKCGEDCKDRVHGFCKDPSFLLVASISTIFILLPFIVYFLKRDTTTAKSIHSEDNI